MLLFNNQGLKPKITFWYFNTSNVTIQPRDELKKLKSVVNFNTSNVTIQLQCGKITS